MARDIKKCYTYTLSAHAADIVQGFAHMHGISKSATVEQILRKEWRAFEANQANHEVGDCETCNGEGVVDVHEGDCIAQLQCPDCSGIL